MLRSRVDAVHAGRTLADWLALKFTYFDRAQWEQALAVGQVKRNGRAASAGDRVCARDEIVFTPQVDSDEPPIDLALLAVDPEFAVIDKPPHLAAHTHGAFVRHTLLPGLTRALAARGESAQGLEPAHRLDRDTSGVLLLSRTPAARRSFERQFAAGAIHKEYVAVVLGEVALDTGTITGAIGHAPASVLPFRRAVVPATTPGARAARTDFAVAERLRDATVLRMWPRTGRTHQIRVHCEALGHPLVGDKLYGRSDAEYSAYVAHLKNGGSPAHPAPGGALRHLLHAQRLDFAHPTSGTAVTVYSPLPTDMQAWIAAART